MHSREVDVTQARWLRVSAGVAADRTPHPSRSHRAPFALIQLRRLGLQSGCSGLDQRRRTSAAQSQRVPPSTIA